MGIRDSAAVERAGSSTQTARSNAKPNPNSHPDPNPDPNPHQAVDPNRSFNPDGEVVAGRSFNPEAATEESSALLALLATLGVEQWTCHVDLHETTDSDESEFRPAKACIYIERAAGHIYIYI